jgi:5-methylcytosine-specific restriction protein B
LADIKAIYEQQFLPLCATEWQAWLAAYAAAVDWASSADEMAFRSPSFQKKLWEIEEVSTIGPGNSVTVTGAYDDPVVVDALWALRQWEAPPDDHAAATHLQAEFDRILALVCPRYTPRRPSARLVRIFTTLRVHDVTCLMDSRRNAQFRKWVGRPSGGLGLIGQNVLARRAVQDELGLDQSTEDAVSYNQFAWFVWERIISPAEDESAGVGQHLIEPPGIVTDTPKLLVLRARVQRKGMFWVSGNLNLLVSVLRAAENGIEKQDLIEQIAEDAPTLKQTSRAQVLSQAVTLGLLSVDRGTYKPTASGRALLEGESAADVLTPTFVRTVFGFALILRDLASGGLSRGGVADRAREYYPNWTSDFASNSLVAWMRDLELVSVDGVGRGAAVRLTEAGEYWASGLPDELEALANETVTEELSENIEADEPAGAAAAFAAAPVGHVVALFSTDPELKRLVFSTGQIRLVHAALHGARAKRFILLAGLSGTGKTSMARAYARAYCEVLGLPPTKHYAQVAVWPDWTDPTGLIGFVNPLKEPPSFRETPALKLLLEANRNPGLPYFLCLDEMNLARVEHYFAPFLSAMEGTGGRLAIHAADEPIDMVPPSIPWPANLFIIGTVNMDETTYPFSDKVLDRAFTFEFWDVDLDAWRERVPADTDQAMLEPVVRVLKALYAALLPARRHFGYRTCDEVLGFCGAGSGVELVEAIDAAVFAKILPKIRGEAGGELPKALAAAADICKTEGLKQCEAKLAQMRTTLDQVGVVRFWS